MSDTSLCPAVAGYVDAYHRSDAERLVSLFGEDGSVSFGGPGVFVGHEQITVVHERIGTFHFEIEAVFGLRRFGANLRGQHVRHSG